MQDQEQKKTFKMKKTDMAWGAAALVILFVTLAWFSATLHHAPQSEWRILQCNFPWETEGVSIEKVEASWKSSKGDARMELRAFSYPVCHITLGKAEGKGVFTLRFLDPVGNQMGDRIRIGYQDGQFRTSHSNSMQVTEKEATIRLEDGFSSSDLYKLHQVNQQEKLWSVEVTCIPEGSEPQHMGYVSIIPHDL